MFRTGKPRAFIHNLRLAVLLSFVAGVVNIFGVLSIHVLTTNVTGHFAFFSEEFIQGNYQTAVDYISYIVAFLAGAFSCSVLVEMALKKKSRIPHTIPILLEIAILACVAIAYVDMTPEWIARVLLFAMGLQNALVTKVSQSTVRTTHLTGLFTDLGIEISHLLFDHDDEQAQLLKRSIYLRMAIILFFFFGGVSGGFLYKEFKTSTLFLAAMALLIALAYENIRLKFHYYRRKLRSKT